MSFINDQPTCKNYYYLCKLFIWSLIRAGRRRCKKLLCVISHHFLALAHFLLIISSLPKVCKKVKKFWFSITTFPRLRRRRVHSLIQHAPHSLSALQKRGEFLCSLSRMTQCLKIPKIVPICLYRVENRIRLLKSWETPSNHFCQLRQFGWNFQTLWMMALET